MTPENFCYWLQGYMELTPNGELSPSQTQIIRDHLALTFNKVTPNIIPNISPKPWVVQPSITDGKNPYIPPYSVSCNSAVNADCVNVKPSIESDFSQRFPTQCHYDSIADMKNDVRPFLEVGNLNFASC